MGCCALIGRLVGGVFAQIGAWRAAFWMLLPLAAGFVALADPVLDLIEPARDALANAGPWTWSASQAIRLSNSGNVSRGALRASGGALRAALDVGGGGHSCRGMRVREFQHYVAVARAR